VQAIETLMVVPLAAAGVATHPVAVEPVKSKSAAANPLIASEKTIEYEAGFGAGLEGAVKAVTVGRALSTAMLMRHDPCGYLPTYE
jgi:hypothetical protein